MVGGAKRVKPARLEKVLKVCHRRRISIFARRYISLYSRLMSGNAVPPTIRLIREGGLACFEAKDFCLLPSWEFQTVD